MVNRNRAAPAFEENLIREKIPVLLLEPDAWRFRGIEATLEESQRFVIIGDRDFARILTLEKAPDDLSPRVAVVADRLIVEYGIAVVPRLIDTFANVAVLVHGEHYTLEAHGHVIAAGASGFFDLGGPPEYLCEAVEAVGEGRIWAPREAISALARRFSEPGGPEAVLADPPALSADDALILRYVHEGRPTRDIALRLQRPEIAVKARLEELYRIYRASTRRQLIAAAVKSGLVV